jgi:outer membrane receptor protein involved in Fe transport
LVLAASLGALAFAGVAQAADDQASAQKSGNTVSEVVVTATKEGKGVKVSKVPISVAAYSQKDLDDAHVQTVQDLFTRTPGVNYTRLSAFGTGFTGISIRGVQSLTSQPTTGIYIDDSPLYSFGNNTNLGGSNIYPTVFDLARVEILRGPQGTLFGSGSEGGTVRFITNEPSVTHMSGYGKAEVSDTKGGDINWELGTAIGGPIVPDKLGFRISADHRFDSGWVDHCVPAVLVAGCASVAEKGANTIDNTVLRGALLWKPVDWLSVEPSLHYQRYHQANPSEIELAISNPSAGVFRQAHSKDEPITDQLFLPTLKLEAELPNFLGGAIATSSSSYVWRKNRFFTDYTHYQDFFFFDDPYPLTGAPDDFGLGIYGITQNDVFEEFRIASSNPAARLTWVVGGFFQSAREFDFAHVIHPDLPDLILSHFGVPISVVLGVNPYQGTYVAFNEVRSKDSQEAFFANFDYKLTSTLKVTVGGRYAHYSEDVTSFIAGPFNATNGETFSGNTSGDTFNPRGVITWTPNEQSLYYVSGSKGYRPGGFNAQVSNASPACQTALHNEGLTVPRDYAPDSIWSVEAGTKQRLFDNHLAVDFSVYHNNWDNIQLSEQIANCGFGAILNLGSAITQGFDLNFESRVGDHLRLDLAVGYTEGHFTKNVFVGTGGPQVVTKGDQISGLSNGPAIPPWTVTAAAEYDFMLGRYNAYGRIEDTYHSMNNGTFIQQDPANIVVRDPEVPLEPSNNIVNMKIGMRFNGMDASLFVDNLADAHPLMSTFHVGQRGPGDADHRYFANTFTPRTVGLNLTANF